MPQTNRKLEVYLEEATREELEALCRQGTVPVAKVRKARVLLLADEDRRVGRKPDWRIAEIVGVSERQVVRIRQKFAREGLRPTLERKPRSAPETTPKFDGPAEARLVTLCCSTPPEGHQRWTLQLLVDELCRLQVVTSVCRETVRQCLKKIGLSRGKANAFRIPKADRARFVAQRERVFDVYHEEFDDEHPLICMDEAAKQVVSDVDPALPMTPGTPRREDHHYERLGVRALLLFFDPLRGWRRVSSRKSRMRTDWAEEIRRLLDENYPHAKLVTLVCDNLNIHDIAS